MLATELYTLSLHDALPISSCPDRDAARRSGRSWCRRENPDRRSASGQRLSTMSRRRPRSGPTRSEEHTSELQSRVELVCRLLLEKKKKITRNGNDDITETA